MDVADIIHPNDQFIQHNRPIRSVQQHSDSYPSCLPPISSSVQTNGSRWVPEVKRDQIQGDPASDVLELPPAEPSSRYEKQHQSADGSRIRPMKSETEQSVNQRTTHSPSLPIDTQPEFGHFVQSSIAASFTFSSGSVNSLNVENGFSPTPPAYPVQSSARKCPICDKAFSRSSSLNIHMHSHTRAKPFACPHKDCEKAFSVKSNRNRHQRGCKKR